MEVLEKLIRRFSYRMDKRYKKFVILGLPRTGSHFLRGLLHSHKQVAVYGEVLHPVFGIRSHSLSTQGKLRPLASLETFAGYLDEALFGNYPESIRAVGFKFFVCPGQDNAFQAAVLDYARQRDLCVLHTVRRNRLDRYLSENLAKDSGAYVHLPKYKYFFAKLMRGKYKKPVPLDPAAFLENMSQVIALDQRIEDSFRGCHYYRVIYEDLCANTPVVMRGVSNFLELGPQAMAPETFKQRQGRQDEWIVNYREFSEALYGTAGNTYLDHSQSLRESKLK